eukprot:COSAG06_NODE_4224_length_4453_cov_275.939136_2_plen_88_part_00
MKNCPFFVSQSHGLPRQARDKHKNDHLPRQAQDECVENSTYIIQNGAVLHSERCASAAHGPLHAGRLIDAGEETKTVLLGATTSCIC